MLKIRVQAEDFEAGAELAALGEDGVGGIASFIGTVRADHASERQLLALHIEHYPGMTEREMQRIAAQAIARWPLVHCTIIHRVGKLLPRQNIVFVGASSPHRAAALAATSFLIDWLKTGAPLWKREEFHSGDSAWVAARSSDDASAARWNEASK
jgi:molybdopterin synthase catalytic subunit